MRGRQWLTNLLLFVPLATAFALLDIERLAALSFAPAFSVSSAFAAMLALYLAMTGAYGWRLRSYAIVDVLALGLFIRSPGTQLGFAHPDLLWFAALGFVYLFADCGSPPRATRCTAIRSSICSRIAAAC